MNVLQKLRVWLGLRRIGTVAVEGFGARDHEAVTDEVQELRADQFAQHAAEWTEPIRQHNQFIDNCYAAHKMYRMVCLHEPEGLAILRTDALIAGDGLSVLSRSQLRAAWGKVQARDAELHAETEKFRAAVREAVTMREAAQARALDEVERGEHVHDFLYDIANDGMRCACGAFRSQAGLSLRRRSS